MAEEHLHQLHVVFNQFRGYNLKLKLKNLVFSKKRSTTWHTKSPKKVCNPAV